MNSFKWLIGGVVGGIIGAAIWAIISKATGYEIGWIAWGVGGLVGIGVAVGAGDRTSEGKGIAAAVIALLAVLGGKYASYQWQMDEMASSSEVAITYVADSIADDYERSGKRLSWPNDLPREQRMTSEDYPDRIWAEAIAEYNQMTDEEKDGLQQHVQANVTYEGGFFGTFGVLDLLWFFLALGTAYSLGAGKSRD